MPPPLAPEHTPAVNRLKIALYHLSRARREMLNAKPYISGEPVGRNYDRLISALEERIDRVRLAGAAAEAAASADEPLTVDAASWEMVGAW